MDPGRSRKIVLTGASGTLGRVLAAGLAARYAPLVLTDIAAFPDPLPHGARFIPADLTDAAVMAELCEGASAIVHFGGINGEKPFETILSGNIVGTHTIFEAARRNGARVVYASSNHVVGFYPRDARLDIVIGPARDGGVDLDLTQHGVHPPGASSSYATGQWWSSEVLGPLRRWLAGAGEPAAPRLERTGGLLDRLSGSTAQARALGLVELRGEALAGEQLRDPVDDAARKILGRGGHFAGDQPSGVGDQHDVGERAADVGGNAECHCRPFSVDMQPRVRLLDLSVSSWSGLSRPPR